MFATVSIRRISKQHQACKWQSRKQAYLSWNSDMVKKR